MTPVDIFRRFLAALAYFAVFIGTCFLGLMRLRHETSGFTQGLLTLAMLVICGLTGIAAYHFIMGRTFSRDPQCCLSCGYDCRETPDRCPECGRENPRL